MKRREKIACVAGARPNFIKIAPIMMELEKHPDLFEPTLVHTGQHYDDKLSNVFFEQLNIPRPDHHLAVGVGNPAEQTGELIQRFDKLCLEEKFDRVLLVGDVTSTLACAIVAAKRLIPTDHVEAGLRSFDRTMPEEINRIVTDSLADTFFVTEPSGVKNLIEEGHAEKDIHFVGNVMIDTLRIYLNSAMSLEAWKQFRLPRKGYGVVTLHRPSNVDDPTQLRQRVALLREISRQLPLVFPVHPRTRAHLDFPSRNGRMQFCEPLGYLEFIGLMEGARVVITDSGGVQEETTALGIPCLTLRVNTERPITVEWGTNTLVGDGVEGAGSLISEILEGKYKKGTQPPLWDGKASQRIVAILAEKILRQEKRRRNANSGSDH